ncbi:MULTISPECIES: AAA family ATPase [unclassified Polaribacter]|uniref:AAA family ATPase n=1 Tax=unclassified Polaribacter TaxID=196858 RepID=UPI0011BD895C|nr:MULTISPECIES: ATP-binding protein [unclassified Polaribacter]TXD50397.1 ATP-binding protein [Polaribacter sp. IC063]TXD57361.1 ATP-binding protein [Polaribacter sp. IC066]
MQNNQQKIVLIGGPGTGKTTIINALKTKGYHCFDEVSRAVTLKAQQQGIEQLFLTEPLLFSEMLLKGREEQYIAAEQLTKDLVFFDRGIPDVHAYMNYFKTDFPSVFLEKSKQYTYNLIFHFSPWKEIHTTDNERYETFEESIAIDTYLLQAYADLKYKIINVPFGTVDERTNFIIHSLSCDL